MKTCRQGRRAQHRALALVLLWGIPSVTHAENSARVRTYLSSIQRLFDDLEYERALSQIHLAQQEPRGAEDELTLALYEGIIQCELGKKEAGLAAFKSALLLRPDATLPVKVAPKVESIFESAREQVKLEQAPLLAKRKAEREQAKAVPKLLVPAQPSAILPPALPEETSLRRYSLLPAITGGTLVIAGGIAWGISRGHLNQLRNDDPRLVSMEDVQRGISRGNTWQTVGVSLLSVGAASLTAATGMYVLGAPDKPVSLGVGTNGTSAVVQGRWP